MRISKKRFVLIALFVFPLVFFLALSTGVNNFKKLPTLTNNIYDIAQLDSTNTITLNDRVSIICFLGKDVESKKGGFFNLNQKIYKEFYGYIPFQMIAIYPKDSNISKLQSDLGAFTDMSKWKFIELDDQQIQSIFTSFKTNETLDVNLYSNKAFLIDKDLNLRGRNNDKDALGGLIYGYNMQSVAELNNKMEDDIKVLLYEYRAAFKNKRKADRKKIEL